MATRLLYYTITPQQGSRYSLTLCYSGGIAHCHLNHTVTTLRHWVRLVRNHGAIRWQRIPSHYVGNVVTSG